MLFVDLPLEILPFITYHIIRPHHLAQVCLVNKDFYACTIRQLYERPAIYAWHREAKKKATQLFWTLANCPNLARYVRRLELRDFPKAILRDSANELTQLCVSGLENCVNLNYCTWTRDGTLKDEILEALSQLPSLQALEINGRHVRNYNPDVLCKFEKLRKISVIMPTVEVVHALPRCFRRNFETLQELTIICKFTSVITDSWLQSLASSLTGLKKLHLAGCPKVTHQGVIDLLRVNLAGLTDLALEGITPSFDLQELAKGSAHYLRRLSSVTLTIPETGARIAWLRGVLALLLDVLSLKQFHLYATGHIRYSPVHLNENFVQSFIDRHKGSLTRFAVLGLPMSRRALEYVTTNAEKLEQLFVSIWGTFVESPDRLGPAIAKSKMLRALHLHLTSSYNTSAITSLYNNDDATEDEIELHSVHEHAFPDARLAPEEADSGMRTENRSALPSMSDWEAFANQYFGEKLTQFGVQTRVWQVERIFTSEEEEPGGASVTRRRIRFGPYESPAVPDVFLVVRT